MEMFRKVLAQAAGLWGKGSALQRGILAVIVVVVLVGIGALVSVSSSPTLVPLFNAPVRDDDARDRIIMRLDQEGVRATVSPAGIIQVQDAQTARRMRGILFRENLIPTGMDPWAIFDRERWTITDFERNVNLRRAITQTLIDHIRALDDVDNANVTIVIPEDRLFASEQNPVSASVIITPRPGSDITENRRKIEGIQRLLRFAIEGLRDENIVITDHRGNILNDFEGMAEWDRLSLIERQTRIIQRLEADYRARILSSLQSTFGNDRVREIDIRFEMDMSQQSVFTEEVFPITIRPRSPGLPFDDSELLAYVPRSMATSETFWEGTGFMPEGPAGVEGHVPPVYRDMGNLFGRVRQETLQVNHELNTRRTQEERSPQINRVTVSVNIDGTWRKMFDERRRAVIAEDGSIERLYTPISAEDLRQTQILIQNAIGFSAARGDSVTVHNIQFYRAAQFAEEDAAYFRRRQMETTIIIFLIGLAALLVTFVLVRTISREIERRKRLEAEERARREEALRQQALLQAEEEGMDISISVEERTRLELQESVINMTREHPEDAAQLIRTWLLED
ncbi:MAG: flagellar M-ring protein FliF [Treponema sp.]|nr:flagellar M-ring protein FliF [Treponema sp.]